MVAQDVNIIADIGGTNMRIAQVDEQGAIVNIAIYTCAEHAGLAEILSNYIAKSN